jgi:Ca-activated chloride channel family protein
MFQFENTQWLYLLFAVPLYGLTQYYLGRTKGQSFGEQDLVDQLIIGRSRFRLRLKRFLVMLALAFLIIALANPQWGTKREKVQSKGSDIILALDISQSMMCEDIAPNRLERAKRFTERMLDRLKGERVGVILFAGSAYLQMPLTTDYAAAKLFIKSANPRLASSQGTAIGDAIALSRKVFGTEDDYHKALIIITDGETHDEGAEEEARQAGGEDMILFFVGVGTEEGGFIPVNNGGRLDYMRDESGEFVKSRLDPNVMKNLANIGDGAYFNVVGGEVILEELDTRIDQLEKKELEQRSFEEFESYFQYFLFLGLALLFISYLFFDQKNERWGW